MATVLTTTFETIGADEGPLRGDVRTAGAGDRPAVVICHGFKGFKDWGMFPKLAERLAHAGFTAVSFNFSGSGVGPEGDRFSEPERFTHATFSRDIDDIAHVVRELREGRLTGGAHPAGIGLFGHSRGGGMSVAYAADDPDISALVTWNAIGNVQRWPPDVLAAWRERGVQEITNARTGEVLPLSTDVLDDIDRNASGHLDLPGAATRIGAPWLIVHGDADEVVSIEEGRAYAAAAGRNATLREIPGGGHTFGARHPWAGMTPELESVMDETVGWFVRHLFGGA